MTEYRENGRKQTADPAKVICEVTEVLDHH